MRFGRRRRAYGAEGGEEGNPDIRAEEAPQAAQRVVGYELLHADGVMRVDGGHYSCALDVADVNYIGCREEDQLDKREIWKTYLDGRDPDVELTMECYSMRIPEEAFGADLSFTEVGGDETGNVFRRELNAWCAEKLASSTRSMRRGRTAVITVAAPSYEKAAPMLAREAAAFCRMMQDLDSEARVMDGQRRMDAIRALTHQGEPAGTVSFSEIERGVGITTRDLCAPSRVLRVNERLGDSRLIVGDRWIRTYVMLVDGYGSHMRDSFVTDLVSLPRDIAVCWSMRPWPAAAARSAVERQVYNVTQENNTYMKNTSRPEIGFFVDEANLPLPMRDAAAQARETRDDLVRRQQHYFSVTTLIMVSGRDEDELEEASREVEQVFAGHGKSLPDSWGALREQAFSSVLPVGRSLMPYMRALTSDPLSHMLAFASSECMDADGIIMGVNADTRNFISYNPVAYEHTNSFVLALPRSGKSFNVKTTKILQTALRHPDDDLIVIDPEGEYPELIRCLGGEVARISETSPDRINPLEISEGYGSDDPRAIVNPIPAKVSFVQALVHMMAPSITDEQVNLLDQVASAAYAAWMEDPEETEPPTLQSVYDELVSAGGEGAAAARKLATLMRRYVSGTLAVFNGPTTVNLASRRLAFDISEMSQALKPIALLVLLDHIWVRVTRNRRTGRRTWLFIDEFQLLIDDPYALDQFDRFFTRGGKWDLYECAITQNVSRILDSEKTLYMLQNSPFLTLLGQSPDSARELAELLTLSDSQLRVLRTAGPGEGLYVFRNKVIHFDFQIEERVCPTIYRAVTTRPADLKRTAGGARRTGGVGPSEPRCLEGELARSREATATLRLELEERDRRIRELSDSLSAVRRALGGDSGAPGMSDSEPRPEQVPGPTAAAPADTSEGGRGGGTLLGFIGEDR